MRKTEPTKEEAEMNKETTEVPEEVTAVLVQERIDPQSSQSLIAKFAPYHAQINAALVESRNITDGKNPTAQKMARTCRLELRRIRCEVENVRKDAKADALRYGKAVDGLSNVFKLLIEPEEDRLAQIEKYAELKEQARIAALVEDRSAKLVAVDADPAAYNLAAMDDATFDGVLSIADTLKRDRAEAERKAESDRIAREKAEAEERERMRADNERLKAEAEAREKAAAKERAKAEAERKRVESERAKERAALEAKIKAEAEAREKAESEIRRAKEQDAANAKKAANEKHRKSVMNLAYADLVEADVPGDAAILAVKAIAEGKIRNVRMEW